MSIKPYEPTTEETLTEEQIEAFRVAAWQHRDYLAAAICEVALATGLDEIADVDEHASELEGLGIYYTHVGADLVARREVVRMIREADVQAGAPAEVAS